MGGINIKNFPSTTGPFEFTFLTNLCLNRNALSSVPPELLKLRHLELLDLSKTALDSLPRSLGCLVEGDLSIQQPLIDTPVWWPH